MLAATCSQHATLNWKVDMNEGRSRATLHVVNSAYKFHRKLIVVCVGVCRCMCVYVYGYLCGDLRYLERVHGE